MRHISMFSAALLLMSANALAETDRDFICRDYADAQADVWSQGKLDRADAGQRAGDSQVVVVMGGEKFLAPLYQTDIVATSFGDTLRKRNQIYSEEFHRCMNSRSLTLALQN
jgi:hypothetical protein